MSKISIIVPVYNAERYLRACVDSILRQSYTDLEVILVDDGSKDTSPLICDEYAAQDQRVRVIHQKNAGVAAARNAGLDAASGAYIAFVDSDDYIDPEMYEQMLGRALVHDCEVVMCDCLKERSDRTQIYTHDIREGYYSRRQLEEEYFEHLLMMPNVEYPPTISNWVLLFRNKQDLPRYAEGIRYSEDLLFGAQLMYQAQSFYYMKGCCYYHYRMNPQSATHRFVPDKWQDYQKLHERICASFGACSDYDFSRQVDLCLLFFVYNAVGEMLAAEALSIGERVKNSREILMSAQVRAMLERLDIMHLPVSAKLKVMTWLYRSRRGLGLLSWYLERKG